MVGRVCCLVINDVFYSLLSTEFEPVEKTITEPTGKREIWQEPESKLTENIRETHTPSKTAVVGFISIIQGIGNLLSLLFLPGNE